jgi:hypothetical protein
MSAGTLCEVGRFGATAAAPVDAIKINGWYVTVLRSVAPPIKTGTSRSSTKFKHDSVK